MKGISEKTLRYAMFAGLILATLAIIFMAPWSDKMGVSGSPQRSLLLWIFAVVGALPFGTYFMYKFAQVPEWNAMPGRFVAGMKVKTFSPYTYVAIAVVGALFAVAALTEGIRLDFQAMVIAASASLFGSIISFFGLLIGQIMGRLFIHPFWVSGGPAVFLNIAPYSIFDAAIWAFAGYNYFKYVHNRGTRAFLPAFLTAWIISEPVHQIGWLVGDTIIGNPWSAAAALIAAQWFVPQPTFPFLPYWVLSALAFVPIGFLAGEAARRAWKGGR
ncbi:MAG: hypothetical protein MUO35_08500 [Anaerolineales bacterium]|nr:hypothetical protein [Anaerolineales bacterium]